MKKGNKVICRSHNYQPFLHFGMEYVIIETHYIGNLLFIDVGNYDMDFPACIFISKSDQIRYEKYLTEEMYSLGIEMKKKRY